MRTLSVEGSEPGSAERFAFGENWRSFLEHFDESRRETAVTSMRSMLGMESMEGLRFLDLGCGSGIFSLAARDLGAEVTSIDYDPQSVGCAKELRRRFYPDSAGWDVGQGDALDVAGMTGLGYFDIVYSWGVLHHTGDLWKAMGNATNAVCDGGRLFVAIYNDQGMNSKIWKRIKRRFGQLPPPLRKPYAAIVMLPRELHLLSVSLVRDGGRSYFRSWTHYGEDRGMSRWHDLLDWVGGYPFEVAKPEEVFNFCRDRGFVLESMRTCAGGLGCNEFVLRRTGCLPGAAGRQADPVDPTLRTR